MQTRESDQSRLQKPAGEFRDYANAEPRVAEFYRLNHTHQTLDFVLDKKRDYLALKRRTMTVWEALEYLNTLVDDSDPDIDFTQIEHAMQTAEAIRRRQPAALVHRSPGLVHDLGQDAVPVRRAAVGRRRRHVPGRLPLVRPKIVFREFFAENPDTKVPKYQTESGIYEQGCGLDNVHMSWGHDEYLYHVVKDTCRSRRCT